MDITKADAMQTLCRAIYDRWGSVALWAHCAIHAAPLAPANMINDKDWAKSVEINQTATQRMIMYVAPLLGQGGTALFFDDVMSGAQFSASYGATKAGQMSLARAWQKETARTGPRVVIETPPPMATALRARFYPGEDRNQHRSVDDVAKDLLTKIGATKH